jgi:hypothetical protein
LKQIVVTARHYLAAKAMRREQLGVEVTVKLQAKCYLVNQQNEVSHSIDDVEVNVD